MVLAERDGTLASSPAGQACVPPPTRWRPTLLADTPAARTRAGPAGEDASVPLRVTWHVARSAVVSTAATGPPSPECCQGGGEILEVKCGPVVFLLRPHLVPFVSGTPYRDEPLVPPTPLANTA